MRAVQLTAARRLDVVDIHEPRPAGGEVLVRVAACGICGSDLSCYKTGVFAGAVLGHEIAGAVEGSGERVIVDPKIPCGACDECAAGTSHRCVAALTQGISQARPGGFAPMLAVATAQLHRVPDGLDLETAALAEPLAVALHGLDAVTASAEPVVVFGLGPLGLLTVAALRARGAEVVGVDPIALRRGLAARLGASTVVAPGDPAIPAARASLVVESSGHPAAIAEAGNIARPGARILLLGITMGEATIWPMVWVTKELRVVGSVAQASADFVAALELLASTPSIGNIITRRIGLDEVASTFEQLLTHPDAGKVLVTPN